MEVGRVRRMARSDFAGPKRPFSLFSPSQSRKLNHGISYRPPTIIFSPKTDGVREGQRPATGEGEAEKSARGEGIA